MSSLPREGEPDDVADEPKPHGVRRLIGWTAGIVVALAVAWVVVHVVISPVNPLQKAPEDHYDTAPCWACHLVMDSVLMQDASSVE